MESDILSLSSNLRLTELLLYDTVTATTHQIHPPGDKLISRLSKGISYRQLLAAGEDYGVSDGGTPELLGFLNQIGGLQRTRSAYNWSQALSKHCLHLLLGILYVPLGHRKSTSVVSLSISVLRAITPVILATGVVATLSWGAGLMPPATALRVAGCYVLLLALGIIVHELAHVKLLAYCGITSAVLQAGMHIGVIHRRPTHSVEAASALVGPLAGAIFCLAAALLLWHVSPLLGGMGLLTAAYHLLSPLPFYGDGLSLKKALHERKNIL